MEQFADIFAFLKDFGFKLVRAEADKTRIRWEDILDFKSAKLMILVQRSSESDNVCIVLGLPQDHYPDKPVGFNKLMDKKGISLSKHYLEKGCLSQAHELAGIIKDHFSSLLQGDLSLLQDIWANTDKASEVLLSKQRKLAFRTDKIGNAEILELPNTEEALGQEYLKQFPTHDYSNERIWVVIYPKGKLFCKTYEIALDSAKNFSRLQGEGEKS